MFFLFFFLFVFLFFFSENVQFLEVKFSISLNRRVFVTKWRLKRDFGSLA